MSSLTSQSCLVVPLTSLAVIAPNITWRTRILSKNYSLAISRYCSTVSLMPSMVVKTCPPFRHPHHWNTTYQRPWRRSPRLNQKSGMKGLKVPNHPRCQRPLHHQAPECNSRLCCVELRWRWKRHPVWSDKKERCFQKYQDIQKP